MSLRGRCCTDGEGTASKFHLGPGRKRMALNTE